MNPILKKNKMLLLYDTMTKILILCGTVFENIFGGAAFNVLIGIVSLCIIGVIINGIMYKKNKESLILQYVVAFNFLVFFLIMVLCIETFWIFFLPFPMLAAFTVYEEKKLVLSVGIACNIVNLIGIARQMNVVYKNNRAVYNGWISLTEIIILFAYTVSIVVTSVMIKEDNERKLAEVEKEQQKTRKLSEDIITIGNTVKECAQNAEELINELDISTDSTLDIFHKITKGNNENLDSVSKQNQMTLNIVDMIDEVKTEVNMADAMTINSIGELEHSKTFVDNIKEKSKIIITNNEELINSINYLLESITKIKSLISGISEISDQTDMLAINASIECSRVGEDGKGFMHVAHEIRNLSDETASLTNEIEKVVTILENNASRAKKVVTSVANEVDEENKMLDMAIEEFKEMNQSLVGLGYNIRAIFDRVGSIVSYSKEIEKNSKELENSSNQVSQTTYQTVSLNKENKNKTIETKRLITELMELSSEMDRI